MPTKKVTAKAIREMVAEFLDLQPALARAKELETQIKAGMMELKYQEIEADQGRVFISTSERVTVPPALAREVLGELAGTIIQVKETVPNDLIKAFVQVGQISEEQRLALLAGAEKTPVTSLHVRPLK